MARRNRLSIRTGNKRASDSAESSNSASEKIEQFARDAMDVAKKAAADNGLKWTQVFLGQKSTIAQDYQYRTWPSRWLISPDGKVIARDIPGDQLKAELEKVLKK